MVSNETAKKKYRILPVGGLGVSPSFSSLVIDNGLIAAIEGVDK